MKFYSTFFEVSPSKVRPGYATFAIVDPPLKLVLIENHDSPGTLNHLGVEVFSSLEVQVAAERFVKDGLTTELELNTTCCYAVQDKVWVEGPDHTPWETYTVLADVTDTESVAPAPCCGTQNEIADSDAGASHCC